jgi:glyoxylase-like metal-dependent hydrolase (beta-lactamase superfamily II)
MVSRVVTSISHVATFDPDLLLHEGDTVADLTVLEVPGHTDGSIALLDRSGFMFVGDALRGDDHGGAQPPSEAMAYDMERAWESVRRLAQVPCDIMLPGHGGPIMPDASGKVARLLQDLRPER